MTAIFRSGSPSQEFYEQKRAIEVDRSPWTVSGINSEEFRSIR